MGATDDLARQAIRSILAGESTTVDPAACGAWGQLVAEIQAARDPRAAFDAMARKEPSLWRLLAGDQQPPKTAWTVAELLAATFPEPRWAVPGLVPVGLTVLAGRPKLGKSWLCLQIAHAVGTGGMVLGQKVRAGRVLFLALEDGPRRLQERCRKQGIPASAAITFHTAWEPLDTGGLATLQSEIERGGYTLAVVDTLGRSLARSDQLDPLDMTMVMGTLQRLAQTANLSILLVDHHRKSGGLGQNAIDSILGSTAKGAAADAVLGLFKEQGKRGAILKVTGREIEERDFVLEFDALSCCWQLLGEAGEVLKTGLRQEVLAAIRLLTDMGETPTTATIARTVGKDRSNISHILADLLAAGQVLKGPRQGRVQPYYLPGQDVQQ